jgi:Spy/CpxP family protein refolding chaperone
MKKPAFLILAGSLIAVLSLGMQAAWANEDHEGDDADHAHHMGMMKDKLGLTDDQKAKMKEFHKSQQEKMKALMDQQKADLKSLKEKVDEKASDAELKAVLDKLSADRKAIQEAQEDMIKNMRAILTPMQQAKMALGMAKRMHGMKMGNWKEKKEKWNKDEKGQEQDGKDGEPGGDDQPKPEHHDMDDDSNR